jgi:hypothetical protein
MRLLQKPGTFRPKAAEYKANSKSDKIRQIAFYFAVALTFIRCGEIHEFLDYRFHISFYLLYIFGIPAILGFFISKSFQRPFRFRPAYYWLGFAVWITITIPFSIWKGGSTALVEDYWRTNTVMVFLLGGLINTWKECRILLRVLAFACVFDLTLLRVFGQLDENGRMGLPFGMFANSNDYPAHLMALAPSVLWVAFVEKSLLLRSAASAVFVYCIFVILSSGSRGGLIALLVGMIYFLFSADTKKRLWGSAFGIVILVIAFSLMPKQAIQRIFSFSSESSSSSTEALESSGLRSQLLWDSILYTLKYPIFGLGPGNFSAAEGRTKEGLWRPAHNSYTAVSSECGIPALILMVSGIASSFLIFLRIGRKFTSDGRAAEFTQAAFCMRLAMVTFCTATFFLNFGYSFHLPMMAGISIGMGYAAKNWNVPTELATEKQPGRKRKRKRKKLATRAELLPPNQK